jgi:hypothetical protein
MLVWLVAGCGGRSSDEVQPPPKAIPYVEVALPSSTTAYHSYERGLQHTMLQIRFDIMPRELVELEARLPCRLGAVETGMPENGPVGTNDRAWYTPEQATRHRSCRHHSGLLYAAFLVDLSDAARTTVYGVISLD